jgi:hypothetical protein
MVIGVTSHPTVAREGSGIVAQRPRSLKQADLVPLDHRKIPEENDGALAVHASLGVNRCRCAGMARVLPSAYVYTAPRVRLQVDRPRTFRRRIYPD